MEMPENEILQIPVSRVEALLSQQRFVPTHGGPKVSVSSGTLPELGFDIPLPETAADLASVRYSDLDHESVEIVFSTGLSKTDIETFYKSQLGKRGYSVSDNTMMPPAAFRVSGESSRQPLLLCGGAGDPAFWILVRTDDGGSSVFVRIHLNPERSPCAQHRGGPGFHRAIMARLPSLNVPAGTQVRDLGSSANDRDVHQNATLNGNTTISEIISAFLDSLAEPKFSVLATETHTAMGYVEWLSEETGDVGLVTVVRFSNERDQYELTSRMRIGSKSPPALGGGFSSAVLS